MGSNVAKRPLTPRFALPAFINSHQAEEQLGQSRLGITREGAESLLRGKVSARVAYG